MDGEHDPGVITMFRDRIGGDGRKIPAPATEPPAPADPGDGAAPSHAEALLRPRPYLRTGRQPDAGPEDGEAAPKKSDPLPRPGDAYRAHARFLGRLAGGEPRLIQFVLGDFTCEGFCYSDLRRLRWLPSAEPGQGPRLLLRFVEAEITDVEIRGRRLEDVHHWIGEGLMPWVWERPPGVPVRDDAATVITGIVITRAKAPGG